MIATVVRLPVPAVVNPPSFVGQRRALAMLALVIANVLWGGSAVASKTLLTHIPPLALASLRVAIALVLLRLLLARKHERPATGAAPALLGFTGVALFCACQNLGLLVADASTTALLNGAIPVLTAGLAVPILHERLSPPRLAALVISVLGVSMIVLRGSGGTPSSHIAESLLPMASAISFAVYAVLGRRAFGERSALSVVAGSTQYGLLFLLPGTILEMSAAEIGAITMQDGLLLLYLGAGCSALAFLLCGYGLSHLEAGHGAVFGNLKPLVGVALAVIVLGEPLSGSHIGGGLLILVGVGMAGGRWFPGRLADRDGPKRSHGGGPRSARSTLVAPPRPSLSALVSQSNRS